jgi:thioredoxin-like negative regulator of GroEL
MVSALSCSQLRKLISTLLQSLFNYLFYPNNRFSPSSKLLIPTWKALAEKFNTNANIAISKLDCSLEENEEFCADQNVSKLPTLFVYKNGEKTGEYKGNRSLDDLIEFVNSHISDSQETSTESVEDLSAETEERDEKAYDIFEISKAEKKNFVAKLLLLAAFTVVALL